MNLDSSHFLALLEQRIALLGSLASSLVLAREGIVSLDIDGLEHRILEQQELCVEISLTDAQIDGVQKECASRLALMSGLPSATASATAPTTAPTPETLRLSETMARLKEVQLAVKKLNGEHQSLLRRSRRTVGALLNSYHSFALTYSEPGARQSALGEGL